ncbi:phosphotransferase family protein [Streptomyces endophyticus]|uniref:Aminoglycoside phosphotransferase family protein n=1 Tax=Streptomyces endophyticus TaxID=714166 RepID=A0ABU6FB84_9ACTN|nr:aminoglycoside phosphotransferase family protein [Streptomyces endophyticus]MEB8340738.1 aminoglycoside phosphotransferase family protein [Streptomyces endophyticus]
MTNGTPVDVPPGAPPDTLLDALVRLGLVGDGDGEAVTGRPLTGGVSCEVWRIDLPGGRGAVCVKHPLEQLRVAGEWRVSTERTHWEARWLRLAADVLPDGAACPVRGFDETGPVLVLGWLDPEQHPLWKSQLMEGRVDAGTAAEVGRRLVAVHGASAAPAYDLGAWEKARPLFTALRVDPYLRATARHHPDLAGRLEELAVGLEQAAYTVVHGDVSPKNIVVGPGGPILLDAECAAPGDPAFDLAFCLNHLLLKAVRHPEHRAGLARAATALRTGYLHGVTWEDPADLDRRAAALQPALALARVDGLSPVEYLTEDHGRPQVRRAAVPLLRLPPADTTELVDRWLKSTEPEEHPA